MRKLKLTSQGEMKAQPTRCGLSLAQRMLPGRSAIVLGVCIGLHIGEWIADSDGRGSRRHYPLLF